MILVIFNLEVSSPRWFYVIRHITRVLSLYSPSFPQIIWPCPLSLGHSLENILSGDHDTSSFIPISIFLGSILISLYSDLPSPLPTKWSCGGPYGSLKLTGISWLNDLWCNILYIRKVRFHSKTFASTGSLDLLKLSLLAFCYWSPFAYKF